MFKHILSLVFTLFPLFLLSQIILDNVDNPHIDLSQYRHKEVTLKGVYEGSRLIFTNAQDVSLVFDGEVFTYHAEDAICFRGSANRVRITGKLKTNGSITFWSQMDSVEITGVKVTNADAGIRATLDYAHNRVNIHHNTFIGIESEAIGIGANYIGNSDCWKIRIHNNRFIRNHKNGIILNNCSDCHIYNNSFSDISNEKTKWTNWAITIGYGSKTSIKNNRFYLCPNRIKCTDSHCFQW